MRRRIRWTALLLLFSLAFLPAARAGQDAWGLAMCQERAEDQTEEQFADFRPVTLGGIREGRLYRSVSPAGAGERSQVTWALARQAGVRAVLNLGDTDGELKDRFARGGASLLEYQALYEQGHVMALGLGADYTSDAFAGKLVRGFTFLAGQEAPWLVHGGDGHESAGFAILVLEALMGASRSDMTQDYMLSFPNLYGLQPGTVRYAQIQDEGVVQMLRFLAGEEAAGNTGGRSLRRAAESWLLGHGMEPEALAALQARLADPLTGVFLPGLLDAYEQPLPQDRALLSAWLKEAQAARPGDAPVLSSVLDHWERVYLDPAYTLHEYPEDPVLAMKADGVPDSPAHAFAVLGYALQDGEMTDELKGRCEAAAAAARAFPGTILVCSGGATGANNPARYTEAGRMKEYLTEVCGIAPERIYIDEEAMTTGENAVNSLRIMSGLGVTSMTIVTSSYHQRWGQVLYNAVAAQYAQRTGCDIRIIGNYCWPMDSEGLRDARIAVNQLRTILLYPSLP